jgi:hypothetical protein
MFNGAETPPPVSVFFRIAKRVAAGGEGDPVALAATSLSDPRPDREENAHQVAGSGLR